MFQRHKNLSIKQNYSQRPKVYKENLISKIYLTKLT